MFFRPSPIAAPQRLVALAMAALLTSTMFASVDHLATAEPSKALLAQMQSAPRG